MDWGHEEDAGEGTSLEEYWLWHDGYSGCPSYLYLPACWLPFAVGRSPTYVERRGAEAGHLIVSGAPWMDVTDTHAEFEKLRLSYQYAQPG